MILNNTKNNKLNTLKLSNNVFGVDHEKTVNE